MVTVSQIQFFQNFGYRLKQIVRKIMVLNTIMWPYHTRVLLEFLQEFFKNGVLLTIHFCGWSREERKRKLYLLITVEVKKHLKLTVCRAKFCTTILYIVIFFRYKQCRNEISSYKCITIMVAAAAVLVKQCCTGYRHLYHLQPLTVYKLTCRKHIKKTTQI